MKRVGRTVAFCVVSLLIVAQATGAWASASLRPAVLVYDQANHPVRADSAVARGARVMLVGTGFPAGAMVVVTSIEAYDAPRRVTVNARHEVRLATRLPVGARLGTATWLFVVQGSSRSATPAPSAPHETLTLAMPIAVTATVRVALTRPSVPATNHGASSSRGTATRLAATGLDIAALVRWAMSALALGVAMLGAAHRRRSVTG